MKRRYHLHLPAVLYCVLVLLVGSAAMNSQNNLLFWIFGLMFSGLVISGLVSGMMMLGVRIRRIDPEHVAVGEPLIVRYQIVNRNRLIPIFNVHIEEQAVGEETSKRPNVKTSKRPKKAGEAPSRLRRSAHSDLDVSGWQRLMGRASAWVMHVGPGETVHGEALFWPTRRGEVLFRDIRVWTTFPFGLVKKSITIDQRQHTRIYPRLYQMRRGLLRSIDTPGPVGTRITQRPGGTDDYFGLREYRRNESIRHIAWKRSAGTEQMLCIERSKPSPPRLRIVLDLSTPTDELRVALNEKWSARELEERAISLAASFIHQANVEGFEVGLTVLGVTSKSGVAGERSALGDRQPESTEDAGGVSALHLPVRRNHWHVRKLLASLAEVDLDQPRIAPATSLLSENERSGLVLIRPDRPQPISDRRDIAYFTGRQLERLTVGAIGWAMPSENGQHAGASGSQHIGAQEPHSGEGAA